MLRPRFEGLIAAPFTPFHPDRSLNLEAIGDYARWLHQQGVVGAFICGTTGEGISLTTSERQQVAQRWMDVAPAGLRVIVHVGHNSLGECRALAAHAQEIGADSVACMAPFFFKPDRAEVLVDWCASIASAAPALPFYYYHIPSMTGVHVKVHDILRHAGNRIPNMVGVKFTFEDLEDFEQCLRFEGGRMEMLFGRDEMLLSALKLGARGAVGSTYNFAAPIYQALIAAYDAGDLAKAGQLQTLAADMIDGMIQSGAAPLAAFKSFMNQVGVDCGPVRLPLLPPTASQDARLQANLEKTGIHECLKQPAGR
jgi:N-acetylneuraminate lyase